MCCAGCGGRIWTHDWLLRRPSHGSYFSLQRELRSEEDLFEKYLKLPVPIFDFILKRITPIIKNHDTHLRETISPGARLEATLLFLITGDYYSRLQHLTRIHESTLGRFIPDICEAIYRELGNEYIKTPKTASEWCNIAEEFDRKSIFSIFHEKNHDFLKICSIRFR